MARRSFDEYYADLFGERWPELRASLAVRDSFAVRRNRFGSTSEPAGATGICPGLPSVWLSGQPFPRPERDASGLCPWYAMDPASALAAEVLGVQSGEQVLDMCAAPGGKSLILAEALAERGELTVNDRSAARRARLVQVLHDYLPAELRARISVRGHDATRWALHERDAYDAILLDAPCSSEAHVLADAKARRDWSPARSKQLARRQYALLAAALDAVRVGGRILYSTCALVPAENDGIVERLLGDRRREGRVQRRSPERELPDWVEPTSHGWLAAPDRGGFGPLYFSLLERLA